MAATERQVFLLLYPSAVTENRVTQGFHSSAFCNPAPRKLAFQACLQAGDYPKPLEIVPRSRHVLPMMFGRLIRVREHRRDPDSAIYAVAEAEADKAIAILRIALARPNDEYEDLGRVTDALLSALRLQPREFART